MAEYIDRKELKANIMKRLGVSDEKYLFPAERTLWRTIADIPAADVVSRDCYDRLLVENDELRKARPVARGKWVRHYTRPNVYEDLYWHCTVCGYKNNDNYANVYHKFCPNCGARMEGDTDA